MLYKLFIENPHRSLKGRHKLLLHFVVLLLLFSQSINAVEIVTNESTLIGHSKHLSKREIRAIFSLKLKQWPDGVPVTVVTMPSNSELHNIFCKEILNVFPHQLKIGWDRVTYAGIGLPPVIVNNAEEMITILKDTPGAIGYIDGNHRIDNALIKRVLLDNKHTAER